MDVKVPICHISGHWIRQFFTFECEESVQAGFPEGIAQHSGQLKNRYNRYFQPSLISRAVRLELKN